MRLLATSIFLLLIFSCEQKPTKKQPLESKANANTRRFAQKPSKYYYTYNYKEGEVDNFNSGYIDTFTANSIRFQLFSNPDSSNDLELQVLKDGKWVTNLKTPFGFHGHEVIKDINGDGFDDFRVSLLRGTEVYLFDAANSSYYPEPIELGFEWTLLDRRENLFCHEYSDRYSRQTSLFKLEGFRQQVLYYADIETMIDSIQTIAYLKLYKLNRSAEDTLLIQNKKMDLMKTEFDYKRFWKDFLRNGYRKNV